VRALAAFRRRVGNVTFALSPSRCTHASLRFVTVMEAEKSQTVRCDEPAGE
jgi:hypothetical protein